MTVVKLSGKLIKEAVRYSRSHVTKPSRNASKAKPHAVTRWASKSGGFLQTDHGVEVQEGDIGAVTHIAGEAVDDEKLYTVGVIHDSLYNGLNKNPVFASWAEKAGTVEPEKGET